ncbi:MAG: hypothetical protein UV61_C0001G0113 [Candidatus Gottesmanbacteria bacterium GW2011_GWB1_43_11]|uniref:DUF6487 domain-containing protein n=1 Tax=Candidatus Gottesmanbacteria bacterium GW2011_GWB1_43_11 TaxID=1618446 RepID=A0A0G1EXN1_9BACT|nr:MAG: hypothetical protein UV04_C0004G0055 [Candidatus Gottesmanbacteria bacterium GW2011_GWA2_42_16]KKS56078.1 MAG: hypothetical protein UV17_C0003G0050 [Candidatus Gottesmanbacteria bacterium GW2011_GWA1_42_26]KKS81611.1 MAG: hypothetical protein UV55_C0011G0005 [Candidatus Gottesmanbacteria bacterium GW2011_GWC1_43_10]KKS87706.1 MAG: hypothetical protein UV61_C0001G0113 [Candidatus Gottesmanbacteria bacterium GW2011_GWB1_43_11]
MKCPKCKGEMEEGVLVGYADGILSWVNKVVLAKERKQTHTYNCKNCGYLESYAK